MSFNNFEVNWSTHLLHHANMMSMCLRERPNSILTDCLWYILLHLRVDLCILMIKRINNNYCHNRSFPWTYPILQGQTDNWLWDLGKNISNEHCANLHIWFPTKRSRGTRGVNHSPLGWDPSLCRVPLNLPPERLSEVHGLCPCSTCPLSAPIPGPRQSQISI